MINKEKYLLKAATYDDVDLLYKWVCDAEVRKHSLNKNPITYETHCEWFKRKIISETSKIFIFYFENIPIGQARIDIENDIAIIDYSIAKEHRGKGFGTDLIKLLEEKISLDLTKIKKLKAIVLDSNQVSKKIFENCNFKFNKIYYEFIKEI